jgi:hypothetical protein
LLDFPISFVYFGLFRLQDGQ